MLDGLLEHLEAHLGEIAGTWDTDPDGSELPFQIVHYAGGGTRRGARSSRRSGSATTSSESTATASSC